MGYKHMELEMPTDYSDEEMRAVIQKKTNTMDFSFHIEKKSLDARNKRKIHFKMRVLVYGDTIEGSVVPDLPSIEIPYAKKNEKIIVLGCGPAGFFAAYVLQQAGFKVTLVERGVDVRKRAQKITSFEKNGAFDANGNYPFGEGGAGTFSDGKLTARSKHLSAEKRYILETYVDAGAPEEILYLSHPHIGSDRFRPLVKQLSKQFESAGGTILFNTLITDFTVKNNCIAQIHTNIGALECDHFIVASGHSAYDTYEMLFKQGVLFRSKSFAVGSRVEHPQELINKAQWGSSHIKGVKAAEYRLTSKGGGDLPVYTFCMCPGGTIVPSGAYKNTQVVNGMSNYQRAGSYANAGCVAAINLNEILKKEVSPQESLDWVRRLEEKFYRFSKGFKAPACLIKDYIFQKDPIRQAESSYPMGLILAPLWEFFPSAVSHSMRRGLSEFSRKIKGFDEGVILGLESKTSSPIQVVRDQNGRCEGFENLYMVGEGSGHAGGIISSGADGIKTALYIINAIA